MEDNHTMEIEHKEFALSWFGSITYVFVLMALQIAIALLVYLPLQWVENASPIAGLMANVLLQMMGYLIFIWWAYIKRGFRFDLKKSQNQHKTRKNQIALLSLALAFFVTAVISPLMSVFEISESLEEFGEMIMDFPIIGFILILGVAPIFEELIFRGILLQGMLKKHNPYIGIVLSGVLFGAFHMNIHQFVAASLLGIIVGWVYYKTGKLWYSMFMHFCYNFSVMVASVMTFEISQGTKILFIPALFSVFIIVYLMKKINTQVEEKAV